MLGHLVQLLATGKQKDFFFKTLVVNVLNFFFLQIEKLKSFQVIEY